MKTTITLPLSTALDISESAEMKNALMKADSEGRNIGMSFDADNKTATLEISDFDGRVYISEHISWDRAKPDIAAWAERVAAALDEEEPGEGHPIDRLFPIIFNEAMKDGLDKAIMLLLCSQCDMDAGEIAWLNADDIQAGVLLRHGIAPRILDYDTGDMLQVYIDGLRPTGNSPALFFNDHGDRISPEEVTAAFAGYALKAGVTATVDDIRAYGLRERQAVPERKD